MDDKKRKERRRAAAALCAACCVMVIIQGAIHLGTVGNHDVTCYIGPFAAVVCLSGCAAYLASQWFKRKK